MTDYEKTKPKKLKIPYLFIHAPDHAQTKATKTTKENEKVPFKRPPVKTHTDELQKYETPKWIETYIVNYSRADTYAR